MIETARELRPADSDARSIVEWSTAATAFIAY